MPGPETFSKQDVTDGEFEIYRLLSSPEIQAYNEAFSRLVLPQAIDQDKVARTLTLPLYTGQTFNDAWNIEDGGSGMDLELARIMPELIEDLSQIDTSLITKDETLARMPNLAFDHQAAIEYFDTICVDFTDEGLLTTLQHNKAQELLRHEQTTPQIVSNGDFYPRNLIMQPDGKVVLIDWEIWNDHSPFFIVDHPENVAAVQYVHMWGNPQWQEEFRRQLAERFSFSDESLDKGIVTKALTLAYFFRKHKELFEGQMSILGQVLSN